MGTYIQGKTGENQREMNGRMDGWMERQINGERDGWLGG
jgi:hypothetical protein